MESAKVLIVDDEAMVRDVLQEILEHEGYKVTAVGSAVAALQEGEKKNFDLLLADIKMPGMSGLELVQKFREVNPQIPSILITGYPSLETVTSAIEQGAYDYIVKPIDKGALCTAVANTLERKTLTTEQVEAKTSSQEVADQTAELAEGRSGRPSNYLTPAEIVATLRNSELFETLSQDELQTIADLCQEETYEENEAIYQQGESSEKLYVVDKGVIALNRFIGPDMKAFVTIDLIKKGNVLGWAALVEPHVHTASAVCCKLTRVLAINEAKLRLVLQKDYRVGFEVMQKFAAILGNGIRMSYEALDSKL